MKKLLTLVALVGMGAFLSGCGDSGDTKPATKPPAAGTSHTPPAQTGPKADADKPKDDMKDEGADKGGAAGDDDKKADDEPADKKEGE